MDRGKKSIFISFSLFLCLVLIGWLSFSQELREQHVTQERKIIKPPDVRIIGPHIDSVDEIFVTNPSVGALPTEFKIEGSRFGDTQGSRVFCIAGAKIGSEAIYEWSDTLIMFPVYGGHPSVPSLNRGQYYLVWIEDGHNHRISNKYNYLHSMKWDDIYPDRAAVGTKVMLKTYENFPFFSPTQGSFKVMFDTWEATVIKWGSEEICVTVPKVSFPSNKRGLEVKVFISNAFGHCVSTKRNFSVIRKYSIRK